jgi:hypothetical protein
MSGIMSVTGAPEGQPQKVGVAVTDILTGLYSVNAILAALHLRDADGHGPAWIDMGLLDVACAFMANQAMNYLTTGVAPERIGNAHQNLTPYQVFDCADGWIIIATGNDAQYQRLCALARRRGDGRQAPEFLTNADRIANRDEMTRRLTGGHAAAEQGRACWPPARPKACRPGRSTIWPRCSPIRRSSPAGCGGRPTAYRACARPSGFPTPRWRRTDRPRSWAKTDDLTGLVRHVAGLVPPYCSRSGRSMASSSCDQSSISSRTGTVRTRGLNSGDRRTASFSVVTTCAPMAEASRSIRVISVSDSGW